MRFPKENHDGTTAFCAPFAAFFIAAAFGCTSAAAGPNAADAQKIDACLKAAAEKDTSRTACIGIVADPCIAAASKTNAYIKDSAACAARELAIWTARLQRAVQSAGKGGGKAKATAVDASQKSLTDSLAKLCPLFDKVDPGHGARRRHLLPPASDRDPRARDRTAGRRRQSALSAGCTARQRQRKCSMAETPRKTFVLVHGAWHGGWCWRRVADLLEAQGHKVFTPTLTGLGDRSHLLEQGHRCSTPTSPTSSTCSSGKTSGTPASCVHSYGGWPGSGALEQIGDRVSSIVWLDAFKPENGQRGVDFASEFSRKALEAAVAKGEPGRPAPPAAGVPRQREGPRLGRLRS